MSSEQPDIKVEDLAKGAKDKPSRLVPKEEFDKLKEEAGTQRKILNWTHGFIIAILIACFLTFVTLTIDAWRFHSETNQKFYDKLEELQNNKTSKKFQKLRERIKKLEKRVSIPAESQDEHKN